MRKSEQWVCNVPVSTIWTTPDSPREIDEPGLKNPIELCEWYNSMTTEERKDLCELNLVQSQLLYGEEVIVDEIDGEWAKIIAIKQSSKKDHRGYPGWVPVRQIKQVNANHWSEQPIALITSNYSFLLDKNETPIMKLSYLTYLPFLEQNDHLVKVLTPSGEAWLKHQDVYIYKSIEQIPKKDGQAIINESERFLGLSYFWGGMSSFGYDCSGFAYNMHKVNGYLIPRDASDQVNDGENIPLDQVEKGDLLFFAYENGKGRVHHVGLYYGDGRMIHSPSTGKNIEIIKLSGTKYEKELCIARRYYQSNL